MTFPAGIIRTYTPGATPITVFEGDVTAIGDVTAGVDVVAGTDVTAAATVTGLRDVEAVVTVVYGVAPAINAALGGLFEITPTDNVAFEVANPTNAVAGQEIVIRIINSTGGALGVLTFDTLYNLAAAALSQPADGENRNYRFRFDGTNWIEQGARQTDIDN